MNDTLHSPSTMNHVDPITLEVIRHGLVSITDQIDANITRTAFSPYIYEYKDFAVGLAGPDGELPPAYGPDGVHPNAQGYALMRPIAESAIAAAATSGITAWSTSSAPRTA